MIQEDWKDDFLQFPDKKLHYYYHSSGKPPILFLHGIMDNGLCWTKVAGALKENYDVYMLDARGHGQSSDPKKEDNFNVDDFIKDIEDFCEKKALNDLILIGHSMGGSESAGMAAWYPERIRAVILEDPGFTDSKFASLFMNMFLSIFSLKKQKNSPKSFEKHLKSSKRFNRKWNPEDQEVWAVAQRELSTHKMKYFLKGLKTMPDWKEEFGKIQCPILVITSQKGIIKPKTVKKMIELNPNVTHKHILKAGHNIRRQQYEEYMDYVKKFLISLKN